MSTRLSSAISLVCALVCALGAMALWGCANPKPYPDSPDAPPQPAAQLIDRASRLSRDAQRLEVAGNTQGAIAKYQEALTVYNEVPAAWNNLGRLYMATGENLRAQEAFNTAAELSPTDPVALYNLGALWESLDYLPDALKSYDESLRRNENYLPALRRFLLVQELLQTTDESTPARLKKALLLESDPWWISRFKRFRQRTDETRDPAQPKPGQS